jgi:hypothetical protein
MQLQSIDRSLDCLSPELVCAYVHHPVSGEQGEAIEWHLHYCDACLLELQEVMRLVSRLWPRQGRKGRQETRQTLALSP